MTSEILLATSILAMNREGDLTKFQIILAEKLPWLRSNSILSLLDDKKAISLPDENAEKRRVIIMIVQLDTGKRKLIGRR